MNIIDVLLILLILLNVVRGWMQGYLRGIFELFILAASLLLGLHFYRSVADWLSLFFNLSGFWAMPVAFILIAFTSSVLLTLLVSYLFQYLPRGAQKQTINRLFGLGPGFINGLILAAITASLLLALPLAARWRHTIRESPVVDTLTLFTRRLETALVNIVGPGSAEGLLLTILPQTDATIQLPISVSEPHVRPELERQMLELINQERAKAGLEPLNMDPALVEVARRHSENMLKGGYFGHYSPNGENTFDRLQDAGITYQVAGENISMASTLSLAHSGLMESPGHRANILRSSFNQVGIGILDGESIGLMVTQVFTN